jgi:hypothetical protein
MRGISRTFLLWRIEQKYENKSDITLYKLKIETKHKPFVTGDVRFRVRTDVNIHPLGRLQQLP